MGVLGQGKVRLSSVRGFPPPTGRQDKMWENIDFWCCKIVLECNLHGLNEK